MKESLLKVLVEPVSRATLRLEASRRGKDDEILEGVLSAPGGRSYPVLGGIPRFVLPRDPGQEQTGRSFGYQWNQTHSWESARMRRFSENWIPQRYGFASAQDMRGFFASAGLTLDAGCGGGLTASLWLEPGWRGTSASEWFGADISNAVDVARERLGAVPGTHFLQADLMKLPFPERAFDVVFSEGVLHHTPSTERALKTVARHLREGGEFLFYVYRKKSPVREFTDDYVRDRLADLPPQEAWEALRSLTRLGQALASLHAQVEVPEDVPLLGIKAGSYDVQRLIYWNFAKLFWNDGLSFEENHHMNFDWYAPRFSFRQTEEEIRRWCGESGLRITHFHSEESGFCVRARLEAG